MVVTVDHILIPQGREAGRWLKKIWCLLSENGGERGCQRGDGGWIVTREEKIIMKENLYKSTKNNTFQVNV